MSPTGFFVIYETKPKVLEFVDTNEGARRKQIHVDRVVSETSDNELQLLCLDFILLPAMEFLSRRNKVLHKYRDKLVLIGQIVLVSQRKKAACLLVLDIFSEKITSMKVLTLPKKQSVSSCAYGPFDNGHIWLGLSDGALLAFDYPGLVRTETI